MYLYSDLLKDMNALARFGKVFSIGKSFLHRDLWAVRFGEIPEVLIFGAIHAREWITAPLIVEMAKSFAKNLDEKTAFLLNDGGRKLKYTDIAFVPMVNPDGVELCQRGLASVPVRLRKELLLTNGKTDFSLWKANANAVDLNVNFDAKWGTGAQNVFNMAPENYIGKKPFSESETRAIANFAKKSTVAVAYHTKGEVIYYGFDGHNADKTWADKFGKELGYAVETSEGSAGGFKDWFVQENLGVGLTFECGDDNLKHPIDMCTLPTLLQQHINIPKLAIEVANENNRNVYERSDKTCKGRNSI